ncbi:MAG: metallophosphoesterase [Microbacteriaceae bacterium]|nr:metallophosphoesterase [Microbacteriaceae bacterium]
MHVLALYDIHGNIHALEAVLADPRAARPDAVVVGGDTVPGPCARAVLERLDSLEVPVHWLRGNGEREVAEALTFGEPAAEDLVRVTAALSAAEIGDVRATALGALPLTLEVDRVLYCHATPRRDDEMLTRISDPRRYAEVLVGVEQSIVVAGHTHQQHDVQVGGVRFVNAGSVGLPYEGDGAARWLWIANGSPDLRRTSYDHVAAGERILAAGWPDARSVEGAMTDPVEAIVVTELFEGFAAAEVSAQAGDEK